MYGHIIENFQALSEMQEVVDVDLGSLPALMEELILEISKRERDFNSTEASPANSISPRESGMGPKLHVAFWADVSCKQEQQKLKKK